MAKINELREHYATADVSDEIEQAEFVPADAPPTSERMTTFAVRLPVPVLNRVRELAGEQGITTSELLRQWVDAGIAAADSESSESGEEKISVALLHEIIDAVADEPKAKPRTGRTQGRRSVSGRAVVGNPSMRGKVIQDAKRRLRERAFPETTEQTSAKRD